MTPIPKMTSQNPPNAVSPEHAMTTTLASVSSCQRPSLWRPRTGDGKNLDIDADSSQSPHQGGLWRPSGASGTGLSTANGVVCSVQDTQDTARDFAAPHSGYDGLWVPPPKPQNHFSHYDSCKGDGLGDGLWQNPRKVRTTPTTQTILLTAPKTPKTPKTPTTPTTPTVQHDDLRSASAAQSSGWTSYLPSSRTTAIIGGALLGTVSGLAYRAYTGKPIFGGTDRACYSAASNAVSSVGDYLGCRGPDVSAASDMGTVSIMGGLVSMAGGLKDTACSAAGRWADEVDGVVR